MVIAYESCSRTAFSRNWMLSKGCLDKKNGGFLGYWTNVIFCHYKVLVFGFPKKEKLIDTGFFPLVFQDLGSSDLLDGLVFLDIE